jgi:hypothetical protein
LSECMDFYEIFAIQKLTYEEACYSLSKSAVIPRSTIGHQCDLFDLLSEDTSLLLGVDVIYYSEGYITFIKLVSMVELSEAEYYGVCAKLALNLDMNIATYSRQEGGGIIVFYPDWNYQQAIEDGDEDDKFIVHVYGDKSNVDDLIKGTCV